MMIEEDFCLHKLVLRDIRPTAIRVLVLRTLLEMKQAMSVSDYRSGFTHPPPAFPPLLF